jgi:hypothetical protein
VIRIVWLIVINVLKMENKMKYVKFKVVIKKGGCKKVYIPRGYCCIYLLNQSKDHLENSNEGGNVCIENLSPDFPCQKVKK